MTAMQALRESADQIKALELDVDKLKLQQRASVVLAYRDEEATMDEIHQATGLARRTISKILKEAGVESRSVGRRKGVSNKRNVLN